MRQGFLRNDLFVAVHEHFMTDTAQVADIVLPATMFVEHDDLYRAGGQNHILLGPKLVEPPATVRTNLFVIEELAKRLGVDHYAGFGLSEREHIDRMLLPNGYPVTISCWSTNGSIVSRASRSLTISMALAIRMGSFASSRIGQTVHPPTRRQPASVRSDPTRNFRHSPIRSMSSN